MWILNFIPDSFLHSAIVGMLTVGVIGIIVGTFGGIIPSLRPFSSLIKALSIVLVIASVYFYGSYSTEMQWRAVAAKLQAEIDKKNVVSAQVTQKIVTKYVDKVKIVKEKGDVIIREVPKYISEKSDTECVIPKSFVMLHDSASKNEVPDSSGGIDGTPSTTKLSTVIETVAGNYTIYYETAEQLKALQEWVKQQEKIYNDDNH